MHRLDRGTSGVLVFALDPQSAGMLAGSFREGAVEKRYVALVRGVPPRRAPSITPCRGASAAPSGCRRSPATAASAWRSIASR
ncbi:MAG: pseudouridine synthase [Sandaracinaceae bacterium]|nr:pseudouridine synthase [Sandaracinaceae bacterium]